MEEGELLSSLIEKMMEDCILYNHIRTSDGYGGQIEQWEPGMHFDAAVIKDSTTEATIAARQGVKEIFTVVPKKGTMLEYHDAFERVSDGAQFRVTSFGKDSEAPEQSTVKISKVTAERWTIPS